MKSKLVRLFGEKKDAIASFQSNRSFHFDGPPLPYLYPLRWLQAAAKKVDNPGSVTLLP
jgi:hypothetical protein